MEAKQNFSFTHNTAFQADIFRAKLGDLLPMSIMVGCDTSVQLTMSNTESNILIDSSPSPFFALLSFSHSSSIFEVGLDESSSPRYN